MAEYPDFHRSWWHLFDSLPEGQGGLMAERIRSFRAMLERKREGRMTEEGRQREISQWDDDGHTPDRGCHCNPRPCACGALIHRVSGYGYCDQACDGGCQ